MTNASLMLRHHDQAGIAILTLNRPDTRNALSAALMMELTAALETIGRDKSIKVVVLAANGPAFCAGHDMREMATLRGQHELAEFFALFEQFLRLDTLPNETPYDEASHAGCSGDYGSWGFIQPCPARPGSAASGSGHFLSDKLLFLSGWVQPIGFL